MDVVSGGAFMPAAANDSTDFIYAARPALSIFPVTARSQAVSQLPVQQPRGQIREWVPPVHTLHQRGQPLAGKVAAFQVVQFVQQGGAQVIR